MQEQPHLDLPARPSNALSLPRGRITAFGWLNIITALGIGLFAFMEILFTFNEGYENHMEISPAIAWRIISEGYQTGLLYIDRFGLWMSTFIFGVPLILWALVICVVANGSVKLPSFKVRMWLNILFVILGAVIYIAFFFSIPGCVRVDIDPYHEKDPRCRLPIRPGVVAPAPIYYGPDGSPINDK